MKTSDNKVPKWVEQYRRKEAEFWEKTYPAKSWEEKVAHWERGIREMMGASESSGADPYEGFNPEAYAVWKGQEPRIDEILELLIEREAVLEAERMWKAIRPEAE